MPSRRALRLVTAGFPDPPALDTAVSRALLEAVGSGAEPETLRLHRPADVVAFGPKDRVSAGFIDAVAAASRHGFASILRLAGGRAAVFHRATLAFSWAVPDERPREGIRHRFEETGTIMAEALRALGVDALVGEVPGEYCPGQHSVNAGGRTKIVGVGQRVVAGAAHVGGVVAVSGSARIREVLVPVYQALGLAWDPRTVGSIEDEIGAVEWEDVREAVAEAFGMRFQVSPGTVSEEILARARGLVPDHAVALASAAAV